MEKLQIRDIRAPDLTLIYGCLGQIIWTENLSFGGRPGPRKRCKKGTTSHVVYAPSAKAFQVLFTLKQVSMSYKNGEQGVSVTMTVLSASSGFDERYFGRPACTDSWKQRG